MAKLAGLQALQDIGNLLTTNWNAGNTDEKTPTPFYAYEITWDQRPSGTDMLIIGYTETVKASLFALDWWHNLALSIECYSSGVPPPTTPGAGPISHIQNMGDEVARILKTNARMAGYGMQYINASRIVMHDYRTSYSLFVDVVMLKTNP